ncbi:unnamed protein product [Vitrella brassicaformis CCMP3155]|uniref:Bulb-type lectin domain-containing protein n=2 Tax=Vitrella brassicaformis TaxID=1169539 RepID=A0A0G4FH60_VITBC|nr:unnamed protein product [Vitrella brassicaformis CCMP3155]|eukprot:CEM12193.1 unnamed protein product [Vitrella brassicaformis CCMP3155]
MCLYTLLSALAFCGAASSRSSIELDRKRFIVEGAVRPYGDGQYEYLHPRPNALYVSEVTSIAVREGDEVISGNLDSLFNVTGDKTGRVTGRAVLGRDNKTLVFHADQPFAPGEKVSVKFGPGLLVRRSENLTEHETSPYEWTFLTRGESVATSVQAMSTLSSDFLRPGPPGRLGHSVRSLLPLDQHNEEDMLRNSLPMDRYRTLPRWAAKWRPSSEGEKAALGGRNKEIGASKELYLFTTGWEMGNGETGQFMIVSREGDLVWWTRRSGGGACMLGATPSGHVVLWDKRTNDSARFVYELNSTYQIVDRHEPGHGYLHVDLHFLFFDGDNKILMSPTEINGIQHYVLHVLDAARNVLLEWRTIDDFIDEADPAIPEETDLPNDFYHANNAERTADGNILITMRNCNQLVLLSGKTGRILWRMGGKTSDFTFIGEDMDPPFLGQHNAQQLPNGNILMYDNGRKGPFSAGG